MAFLFQGDVFDIPLADKSAHCVVTSPPYWGLRKYSGEQGYEPLGLEPTPEEHVERTVMWAREVWRVLRDDGVFWLNYGDCYAGSWGNYGSRDGGQRDKTVDQLDRPGWENNTGRPPTSLVKMAQGNLMMMPHRVAIALQDDGWIVRNDVVWHKPNPMPESVAGWRWESKSCICRQRNDRGRTKHFDEDRQSSPAAPPEYGYTNDPDCPKCHGTGKVGDPVLRRSSWRHTRAHEYVFQLTKKMQYWSDQEAVREGSHVVVRKGTVALGASKGGSEGGIRKDRDTFANDKVTVGRNPRSVMEVPTASYKGAHYATFPPNLIAPLIRASCPRWACPECGQGWAPVVEKNKYTPEVVDEGARNVDESRGDKTRKLSGKEYNEQASRNVTSYRPTCDHPHTKDEAVPGIVFDPFVGSGTTVMVAQELLRRGIGMDLSRPYLDKDARVRAGIGGGKVDDLPMFQYREEKFNEGGG